MSDVERVQTFRSVFVMSALSTHEPAVVAAMARCLAARTLDADRPRTAHHATACGWCPYPIAELKAAVSEFNAWADFSQRHGTSGQLAVRRFNDLPRAEQEALIVDAQELESDEKPPATSLGLDRPGAIAPLPDEEVSPWLA